MKIKAIKNFRYEGVHVGKGKTIDVDKGDCRYLCAIKKAVPADKDAQEATRVRGPLSTENDGAALVDKAAKA